MRPITVSFVNEMFKECGNDKDYMTETDNEYILIFHDDEWTHVSYKDWWDLVKEPGHRLKRSLVFDENNKLVDTYWEHIFPKNGEVPKKYSMPGLVANLIVKMRNRKGEHK